MLQKKAELALVLAKTLSSRRGEAYSYSKIEAGIPRGGLTEISGAPGSGKTTAVLGFLAENPRLRTAWVEDEFSAYPCAFPQYGVALERVLFAEAGANALWTAHQILRSRIFDAIVIALSRHREISEIDLRRLQLSAEQSSASVIVLAPEPTEKGSWSFSLQLKVHDRRLHVIKTRNHKTLSKKPLQGA